MNLLFCICAILFNPQPTPQPPAPIAWQELPILLTHYDPADYSPFFRNGERWTEADYRTSAACIPEWLGKTVVIEGIGALVCKDTGSAVLLTYNAYYDQWVIHVDITWKGKAEPYWNYWLVWGWRLGE